MNNSCDDPLPRILGYGAPVVVVLVTTMTALGTQEWANESYASEDSE